MFVKTFLKLQDKRKVIAEIRSPFSPQFPLTISLLISLSLIFGVAISIGAGLLIGFGIDVFNIIWVTVLQEMVPVEKQGRVFSIDGFGSLGIMPIGLALAGIATDAIGPAWVFVAGGIAQIILVLIGLCVPGIRNLD